jgi:hypothetical protein
MPIQFKTGRKPVPVYSHPVPDCSNLVLVRPDPVPDWADPVLDCSDLVP